MNPLLQPRPLAVWIYSGLVLAVMGFCFIGLLPLARRGELSPFSFFIAGGLLIAGIEDFFIKRVWGIVAFAIGELYALSWQTGPALRDSVLALALLAPMVVIAVVYRGQFRVF